MSVIGDPAEFRGEENSNDIRDNKQTRKARGDEARGNPNDIRGNGHRNKITKKKQQLKQQYKQYNTTT